MNVTVLCDSDERILDLEVLQQPARGSERGSELQLTSQLFILKLQGLIWIICSLLFGVH